MYLLMMLSCTYDVIMYLLLLAAINDNPIPGTEGPSDLVRQVHDGRHGLKLVLYTNSVGGATDGDVGLGHLEGGLKHCAT